MCTHHLTLDRAAIDGKVAKVSEKLLSAVLALNKLEQLRCVINEL